MTPSQQKQQRKIVSGLAALLEDEERELPRFRRLRKLWNWIGALLIAAALFASASHQWFVILAVVAGVIGGFLGGISVLYASFLEQWPILKPLLNREAVQEAARAVQK